MVAQLVEQRTENPRVTGSIPVLGIFLYDMHNGRNGRVAQVVEHLTFNQVVRGSNPRTLMLNRFSLVDKGRRFFIALKSIKNPDTILWLFIKFYDHIISTIIVLNFFYDSMSAF